MLEGLLAAHRRYDELSAQLSQPDAAADLGRYRALMKKQAEEAAKGDAKPPVEEGAGTGVLPVQ